MANKAPTPDEVVDELTKDLESQCISSNEENPTENIPEHEHDQDEESEHECDESSNKPVDDDYIDEESLKLSEVNLTEEELESRHKEALELKLKGNDEFKNGLFIESIETYTQALRLCPLKHAKDRAILYSNRAASKTKLERNLSAIDDCTKSIELDSNYLKAYLRRAKLNETTEKFDESLEDWKKILELDPSNNEAKAAVIRLPPIINERNEKLKTEMLGKLKDLGNMFLKPFGLSTENFQLQQDPNTGGYSVNFQK